MKILTMTLFSLLLSLMLSNAAAAETIFEVQYTTDPGDGTYPSPLQGQLVTISGVVTANNYFSSGYFVHDPAGGPWHGILIWDQNFGMPQVGELLEITGTVEEYSGITEINYVQSRTQLSPSEPLPPAAVATSGELQQEAYEGCWSRLLGVTVASPPDNNGQWWVDDGSGDCLIEDNLSSPDDYDLTLETGTALQQLSGILIWRWGEYSLNPRSEEDLVVGMEQTAVTVDDELVPLNLSVPVDVNISSLLPEWGIDHYQFNLQWDELIASCSGWETAGTLSDGATLSVTQNDGELVISCDSDTPISGSGTLLKFLFRGEEPGTTLLTPADFILQETPLTNLTAGELTAVDSIVPTGDTLTVIQRPILTIPALVSPGDTLEVLCDADPGTAGWTVDLLHPAQEVPLELLDAVYDAGLTWWRLQVLIPEIPFYEQFDLRVAAADLETDVSRRAVKVNPAVPDQFYFAHITDTHLPTHLYWDQPGAESDSSEMRDLRAILDDLAVINPQFILLTGDLVNEGELEDFLYRRYYTRAKGILGESVVPIYLTAGNHDLGGWTATPPPDGTARRDWWRFFGWSLCDETTAGYPWYTQNYGFDFGPLHIAAIEAYDNYDSWRYNIYGSTSFTSGQLDWLDGDLAATTQPLKVLAYHMDFADQINLNALGLDMSLWGHIHSSSGNINQHPYDLSTDNACDGSRAFRLIRVEGVELQPLSTMNTGGAGQNLTVGWSAPNDGSETTLTATVNNQYNVDFPEGLIRFYLSSEVVDCEVTGGTLFQMIRHPEKLECQVTAMLDASSSTVLSVTGQAGGPENLSLQVIGDQLMLTWDPMPGVTAYRVYQAADPYGPFQEVSGEGEFTDSSWLSPLPQQQGFYRVTGVF